MDVEFTSLKITGYGDEPVPNQFLRLREETTTLAVLLPGLGYTADMPLFYYAELIALRRGWDVLRVDYDYRSIARDASTAERKERLQADVDPALAAARYQRPYETVVLVGKSLGTWAMEHLLSVGVDGEVWNVWLTPLIDGSDVRAQIEAYPGRTFVAIGTKDFAYDAAYLDQLQSSDDVDAVVIEGANHSLSVGDVRGSIRALGEVMSRLDAFLPPA